MCLTITFSPLILCKIMKKTEKMFLGGKGAGPNGEEVEAAAGARRYPTRRSRPVSVEVARPEVGDVLGVLDVLRRAQRPSSCWRR